MSCLRIPSVQVHYHDPLSIQFTLSDADVSVANAIRRTILANIPAVVIDPAATDIAINTSRFSNEIIKHRLSCIPVHHIPAIGGGGNNNNNSVNPNPDISKYSIELDVHNNRADDTIIVTTEHINVFYHGAPAVAAAAPAAADENAAVAAAPVAAVVDPEFTRKVFPATILDNGEYFIDILRLRPAIGLAGVGDQIKLRAQLKIDTAESNACFNVVSKCTFFNTVDAAKAASAWAEEETRLRSRIVADSEAAKESQIRFHKKDFEILRAQRYFLADSFEFRVESIGTYAILPLMVVACDVIITRLQALKSHLETGDGDVIIQNTPKAFQPRAFDILLRGQNHTLGKLIEYVLYDLYYEGRSGAKSIIYCGFNRPHPHEPTSIIRIVLSAPSSAAGAGAATAIVINNDSVADKRQIADMFLSATHHCARIIDAIRTSFAQLAAAPLAEPARIRRTTKSK